MTLPEYLQAENLNAVQFAEAVGAAPSTLYRILSGERRPRLELMERIASVTNNRVTPNDFANLKKQEDPAGQPNEAA